MQYKYIFKRNGLAALLLATGAMTLPNSALACGADPFIGEICTFSFDFCPQGFLEANGQVLPTSQYQALFSLLGNRFGGNGSSTFALPDLRGRTPIGKGTPTNGTANYQFGAAYGASATQLTTNQLPAHSHAATLSQTITATLPVSTLGGTLSALNNGDTGYLAALAGSYSGRSVTLEGPYTATAPTTGSTATLPVTVSASSATITVAASPAPTAQVPTLSPSLAMTFCVAVQGNYPPRS